MRKWYKFGLDSERRGIIRLPKDQDFTEHQQGMAGYSVDEFYAHKKSFFDKYLTGYQYGRFEHYNDFLRMSLNGSKEILSVASGRCANELALAEDGYLVLCSDLDYFAGYEATKKLFPEFRFQKLDALNEQLPGTYDAVISLGLIYLFDEDDLKKFFGNVARGLKPGGIFILDAAGSPHNFFSTLIHHGYLPFETAMKWVGKSLRKKSVQGFVIKHHGYHRSDREILEAASAAGFSCADKKDYAFLTEFRRSFLFNKFVPAGSRREKIFIPCGRVIPYVRMFKFVKQP